MSKMNTKNLTSEASKAMARRVKRSLYRRFCLLLLFLCVPLSAFAQAPAPAQPKADSDGFVADPRPANMTAMKDESIAAAPLVAAAYGFIWLAVLVFVGSVAARTTKLESEIGFLQEKLEKGASR